MMFSIQIFTIKMIFVNTLIKTEIIVLEVMKRVSVITIYVGMVKMVLLIQLNKKKSYRKIQKFY